MNTLVSLSTRCQRGVTEADYEVIVFEGAANDPLGAERAAKTGNNVRHAGPAEDPGGGKSRLDVAHAASRAPTIGFLDGSSLVTPRLLEHVLLARRLVECPLIVVPAYELGRAASESEPEERPADVLSRVDWLADPYELFEYARFSTENDKGYLCSLLQSEGFFCTRAMCDAVRHKHGWRNARTHDELYALLLTRRENRLVALGGEGRFHQHRHEPRSIDWSRKDRQPLLFGAIPGQARDLFQASIGHAAMHHALAKEAAVEEWPLDGRREATSTESGAAATIGTASGPVAPRISIVVVVYRIPRQAENTIYSLSTRHQWNVDESDYEIIVVENRSASMLGEERARALGENVRYFVRDEPGVSPAPALNFGVSQARGPVLGLMIDGARMVTPRVIEHALMACRVHDRPLVVVPGYHLGHERQFLTARDGYDEEAEQALLAPTDWRRAGHNLFDVACLDDTTLNGFLNPLLESTCLFCSRDCYDEVGGTDERFDLAGGGIVNLDLFDLLCRLERTKLFVLWGEGSFHQYHGGTSSKSAEDREAMLETFRAQYDAIRGHPYATFDREPLVLGSYVGPSFRLFIKSAWLGRVRYGMIRSWGRVEWPNG